LESFLPSVARREMDAVGICMVRRDVFEPRRIRHGSFGQRTRLRAEWIDSSSVRTRTSFRTSSSHPTRTFERGVT